MKDYISCADTAKLIRKALKANFPGTKFYVRSKTYSGGASITIDWIDGPTAKEVNTIGRAYEGAGFDGMIDMKYSASHWLNPDGTVELAECKHKGLENARPNQEARKVHFGADYVRGNRHFTKGLITTVFAATAERTGWEVPEVLDTEMYISRTKQIPAGTYSPRFDGHDHWFHQVLHDATADTVLETVDKHFPRYDA